MQYAVRAALVFACTLSTPGVILAAPDTTTVPTRMTSVHGANRYWLEDGELGARVHHATIAEVARALHQVTGHVVRVRDASAARVTVAVRFESEPFDAALSRLLAGVEYEVRDAGEGAGRLVDIRGVAASARQPHVGATTRVSPDARSSTGVRTAVPTVNTARGAVFARELSAQPRLAVRASSAARTGSDDAKARPRAQARVTGRAAGDASVSAAIDREAEADELAGDFDIETVAAFEREAEIELRTAAVEAALADAGTRPGSLDVLVGASDARAAGALARAATDATVAAEARLVAVESLVHHAADGGYADETAMQALADIASGSEPMLAELAMRALDEAAAADAARDLDQ